MPPTSAAAASDAPTPVAAKDGTSTVFDFSHRIFGLAGARFALDQVTQKPTFYVNLGDLNVGLAPAALCREFSIADDSHDAELVEAAENALQYVREVRPGDSIPRELLDGSASWTVEDRHRMISRAKLIAQIGGFMKRSSEKTFTLADLLTMTEDPIQREEVQAAFSEMAVRMGLGRDRKQEVVDTIESYGRELAYIEALRDRYAEVRMIDGKIGRLCRLYGRDRSILEELQRISNLMKRPIGEFDKLFLEIDAHTGEVTALLKNVDGQVKFIRTARDDLHRRLMQWDDLIAAWRGCEVECSRPVEDAVRQLYRFVAARYAPKVEWR
jgi:hypothetical protein